MLKSWKNLVILYKVCVILNTILYVAMQDVIHDNTRYIYSIYNAIHERSDVI